MTDPLHRGLTAEECGLHPVDVSLLRVWTYPTPEGHETVHATYVGYSDDGDVVLSDEHDASRWVTPGEYVPRWCSEELETSFPDFAVLFRQIRRNCELLEPYLGDR